MFQVYVKGADEAIALYERAFGAKLLEIYRDEENGGVIHSELDAFGQILAVSDIGAEPALNQTMQFCFHFGDENAKEIIDRAYAALKENALHIDCAPEPCAYSSHMCSLVDRFGVYWCLFV